MRCWRIATLYGPDNLAPLGRREPSTMTSRTLPGACSPRESVRGKQAEANLALGVSLLSVFAGVLLTLQVTLEVHWRIGLPSTLSLQEIGTLLLSLASFIVAAGLVSILPVRGQARFGHILTSRITDSGKNWQEEPLRSFIELFLCASAVWHTYAATDELVFSLLCGVLCSWAVIFGGEVSTEPLRRLERAIASAFGSPKEVTEGVAPEQRIGCSISLLALYCWGGLQLIYAHVHDLLLASSLAALMFFGALVLAKVGPHLPGPHLPAPCLPGE